MREGSSESFMDRQQAFLVKFTWGAFRERLGVAVAIQREEGWMVRFGTGATFEQVDRSHFEIVCQVPLLEKLLAATVGRS